MFAGEIAPKKCQQRFKDIFVIIINTLELCNHKTYSRRGNDKTQLFGKIRIGSFGEQHQHIGQMIAQLAATVHACRFVFTLKIDQQLPSFVVFAKHHVSDVEVAGCLHVEGFQIIFLLRCGWQFKMPFDQLLYHFHPFGEIFGYQSQEIMRIASLIFVRIPEHVGKDFIMA